MDNLFEVTIEFTTIQENGSSKKAKEKYLAVGVSFGDVETKALEYALGYYSDACVLDVKRVHVGEVLNTPTESDDAWFLCTAQMITLDEASQKERKTNYKMLVQAEDIEHVTKKVKDAMGSITDYTIVSTITKPYTEYLNF